MRLKIIEQLLISNLLALKTKILKVKPMTMNYHKGIPILTKVRHTTTSSVKFNKSKAEIVYDIAAFTIHITKN